MAGWNDLLSWGTPGGAFWGGIVGNSGLGAIAGGLPGLLGGAWRRSRSAKRKKRRAKRLAWAAEDLGRIAQTEGWGPEMQPLAQALAGRGSGKRMLEQQAEFYGRPGSYRTMGLIGTLLGMERPEFYGQDYENAVRRQAMGAYESKATQAQDQLARMLAARGESPEGMTDLMTSLAQGQASVADQLASELAGLRASEWDTTWGQKANLLGLLANFVNQQQAAPFVVKAKEPPRWMQALGLAGGLLGGVGGLLSGLK